MVKKESSRRKLRADGKKRSTSSCETLKPDVANNLVAEDAIEGTSFAW